MLRRTLGDGGEPWPLSLDLDPFDALVFDLDGTLVDTMPLHGHAYGAVFGALGFRFTLDDYLAHVGPPARVAIPAFAAAAGMPAITDEQITQIHRAKKQRFEELLRSEMAPELATAQLLTRHAGRKPMALVSSGNRDGVEAILAAMHWRGHFVVVISGDDVALGKPHAEPYRRAAELLGVAPHRCIAFEDTESGIRSAVAAGMNVADVTQPGSVQLVEAEA